MPSAGAHAMAAAEHTLHSVPNGSRADGFPSWHQVYLVAFGYLRRVMDDDRKGGLDHG
jgi:hypothetical protein